MSDTTNLVLFAILANFAYMAALALVAIGLGTLIARRRERFLLRKRRETASSDGARIRSRITRMARPTLLMTPTKQPSFSKMGGRPELPEGQAWPFGDKLPLSFLTQIDLAEARAAGGPDWLPEDGRLYAFYDEPRMDCADLVRVIHSREPAGEPAPYPYEVSPKLRFTARPIAFLRLQSVPSLDWLGVDVRELDDNIDLDELANLPNEPFGDELQHRVGGYPSEIQEEQMALTCERIRRGRHPYEDEEPTQAMQRASKAWRLLLQIDSDPGLKMNWGDGGMLYVFIREQDARKGDFSQTVTITQTY